MLFEFAESNAYDGNDVDSDGIKGHDPQIARDFGATWNEDYATRTAVGGSINKGNYWKDVSLAL